MTFSGTVNVFVTYPSGKSVNLDGSGNVYTTGAISSGTADFDPGAGTSNLTSAGGNDVLFGDGGQVTFSAGGTVLTIQSIDILHGGNDTLDGAAGNEWRQIDQSISWYAGSVRNSSSSAGTNCVRGIALRTLRVRDSATY